MRLWQEIELVPMVLPALPARKQHVKFSQLELNARLRWLELNEKPGKGKLVDDESRHARHDAFFWLQSAESAGALHWRWLMETNALCYHTHLFTEPPSFYFSTRCLDNVVEETGRSSQFKAIVNYIADLDLYTREKPYELYQVEGQTERVNAVLETHLRAYVSYA